MEVDVDVPENLPNLGIVGYILAEMGQCAIDNKPEKFPKETAGIWAESIGTHLPVQFSIVPGASYP